MAMLKADMTGFGNHFSGGWGGFGDGESFEERLNHEAEELMRQGRYHDAAARYEELRRKAPTDLWADLGYISALECAGKVGEAENLLEEAAQHHRRNRHVQRFRHMFFERREDPVRAGHARQQLAEPQHLDDEPIDQLADLYFNQGRYHEAHGELQRLLREESIDADDAPLMSSIYARIGACLRQESQLDAARTALNRALTFDADNHWTLSELAECERAAGNALQARIHYENALTINPEDQWCRGHLAQLEHEQGNSERAVTLYESILAQQPQPTWALVELAQVLTEIDPERSRNLALHALQEDPSYPWAYAHLGHLARLAGRMEEARHRFQQALSASPGSSWILHELADTCRHLGRMEEALTHLEHARNGDPFDPTTCGFLGDTLRANGRLKEARAYFAKAVELDPQYTWAWRELAEIQALMGEHDDAQAAYDEACRLEPGSAINDGLMAFLLRCRGDHRSALPFLRRACGQMSDYAWAWRELVELLLSEDLLSEAEEEARKGLQEVPHFGPLRLLLAESLRRQGRRDEALSEIETALSAEPEVPQLWAMRAELLSDSDPARALRYARRAARSDPAPEFQLLLASILRLNGRGPEARSIARDISRSHPQAAGAWLLLSDLAEQRGDLRAATAAARLGLRHSEQDERLRLRLARLEWQRQQGPGLQRLDRLFTATNPNAVPWREAAVLFAQANRATDCHRSLSELLRCSGPHNAEAWRTWCECEVHLGNHQAALNAIEKAVAVDPQSPANRLLAAALLEQHERGHDAIAHLEFLRQHPPAGNTDSPEHRFVLRQLAGVYARHEQPAAAAQLWDELLSPDPSPELVLEAARFFRSAGHQQRAEDLIGTCLSQAEDELVASATGNALLVELSILRFHREGAVAAAEGLCAYEPQLLNEGKELLAQLWFAGGQHQQALAAVRQLIHSQQTAPPSAQQQKRSSELRRLQTLELRCLLALGASTEALEQAQRLCAADQSDETTALLLAELHTYSGAYATAIATLRHPALPDQPSIERCLLLSILLLHSADQDSALAYLYQQTATLSNLNSVPPLLQLLQRAWPLIPLPAAVDPEQSPPLAAIRSFPPLVKAACLCAQALTRQGHHTLAATLVAAVAEAHDQQAGPGHARHAWRLAATCWCRVGGQRRQAWRAAWRARSPLALLRCCLP